MLKSLELKKKAQRGFDGAEFRTEASLVSLFVSGLESGNSPWGQMELATEYSYNRGRPDIVAMPSISEELFSFEAKLQKWKIALQQAYRNTCFAHRSFVVLPEKVAHRVVSHESEFRRRNVGLCTVTNGEVRILISAPLISPIQPILTKRIAFAVREEKKNASS